MVAILAQGLQSLSPPRGRGEAVSGYSFWESCFPLMAIAVGPMTYRNPVPTVDIIIEMIDQPRRPFLLIQRQNPPHGWALPGGFVDYGETLEAAARREAQEETGLTVELVELFYAYSDPQRDPRQHTLSVVFIAAATGTPQAADDAAMVGFFDLWELPHPLCFDHHQILQDYRRYRYYRQRPNPSRSLDRGEFLT